METQKCKNCGSEEYFWVHVTEIIERPIPFLGSRYKHRTRCKCFKCGLDFRTEAQGVGTLVHGRPA